MDSDRLLRFPKAFFLVPLEFVLLLGGQSGDFNVDLANKKLLTQLTRECVIRSHLQPKILITRWATTTMAARMWVA